MSTTCAGNPFQSFVTLWLNTFCLKLDLQWRFASLRLWPLVFDMSASEKNWLDSCLSIPFSEFRMQVNVDPGQSWPLSPSLLLLPVRYFSYCTHNMGLLRTLHLASLNPICHFWDQPNNRFWWSWSSWQSSGELIPGRGKWYHLQISLQYTWHHQVGH